MLETLDQDKTIPPKKASKRADRRASFVLDEDTALKMRVHIERLYREVEVDHTLEELVLALTANYVDAAFLMLNDPVWTLKGISKQMRSDALTRKAKQVLFDEATIQHTAAVDAAFAAGREEMISANEARMFAQLEVIKQRLGIAND